MNIGGALVSSCLQLFWPAHCAGCDVVLQSDDAIFCGPCAQGINPIVFSCTGCALPQWGQLDGKQRTHCSDCARRDFVFSSAFAAFEYGEALSSAIIRMKHGGRPDLARRLARIFDDTVKRALDPAVGPSVDVVCPVPLHPRKLRRRGFNQALELARAVLTRLRDTAGTADASDNDGGGPVVRVVPALERELLLRVRDTRELGRHGPGAREVEVFGAFAVADPAQVVGRRFLVLDDVMTTGATLNECAETLLRAGAREVRVAALARAVA